MLFIGADIVGMLKYVKQFIEGDYLKYHLITEDDYKQLIQIIKDNGLYYALKTQLINYIHLEEIDEGVQ